MNLLIDKTCEQGSESWFKNRVGSIGASSISRIITSTGGRSKQRKAYLYELAGEKLTGEKADSYSNKYMKEGIDREPESRQVFEFIQKVEIEEVALIKNPSIEGVHCSPDGILIGKEEGLELKNVIASTQVKYLDKEVLPTEYKLQVQFSLFVTGWGIWWFSSYHPGLKVLIVRVRRDESLIKLIKAEINIFIRELNQLIERLRRE